MFYVLLYQAGSGQWPLSGVIGTWEERFCHVIRHFVNCLLDLTMFYMPDMTHMHLKERAIDPTKLLRVKGGISLECDNYRLVNKESGLILFAYISGGISTEYDNYGQLLELKSQAPLPGFARLMKCTSVGWCALLSKKEPVGMKG
jgi:hypothetical protein